MSGKSTFELFNSFFLIYLGSIIIWDLLILYRSSPWLSLYPKVYANRLWIYFVTCLVISLLIFEQNILIFDTSLYLTKVSRTGLFPWIEREKVIKRRLQCFRIKFLISLDDMRKESRAWLCRWEDGIIISCADGTVIDNSFEARIAFHSSENGWLSLGAMRWEDMGSDHCFEAQPIIKFSFPEHEIVCIDRYTTIVVNDLRSHEICNHWHFIVSAAIIKLYQSLDEIVGNREIFSSNVIICP